MYANAIVLLLATTASLVSAHGKIAVAVSSSGLCLSHAVPRTKVRLTRRCFLFASENQQTGDAGGNTTALGIQGGVVPGTGPNSKTEVDTTIFQSRNAMTDGLGRTEGQGKNTLDMMTAVAAQSGSTLPQVSASNGSLSGTLHIVTTDGAGPYTAVVDPTGQGSFSQGTKAEVTTQVPGKNGNIAPGPLSNNLLKRALWHAGIYKRALNVDSDYVSAQPYELP